MKVERVYIAGPMRGLPDLNFPAFDAAAAYYRRLGFEVISPAEQDREILARGEEVVYADVLVLDIALIRYCDAVALLPGWTSSPGALAEKAFADAIDIKVWGIKPDVLDIERVATSGVRSVA